MEEQLYLHNVERIEVIPRPKEGRFEVKITLDTSGHYRGIKVRRITRRNAKVTRKNIPLHAFLESKVQSLLDEARRKSDKVIWMPDRGKPKLSYLKDMGAREHQIHSEMAGACEPDDDENQ